MPHDDYRYTSRAAYAAEFDEPEVEVPPRRRRSSEAPLPARERWWTEAVEAYVEAHAGEWSKQHASGVRMALRRFEYGRARSGRKVAGIWARVGMEFPGRASLVTVAHVVAVRDSPLWAPKYRSFLLQALRGFVRAHGNSNADNRRLWAIDGTPLERRWLTKDQLAAVWSSCRDDYDRLAVAGCGFNGLRRVEVLRLRPRDVSLDVANPTVRIWGKGPNGGKYRTIPVSRRLYTVLVTLTATMNATTAYFPWKTTAFDDRLAAVGKLAGLAHNPSGHTLRRTFGRLAYNAEVPLIQIQRIYGHASPVMTAHYVGVDQTEMAAGLERFELSMES
jgi:integrase